MRITTRILEKKLLIFRMASLGSALCLDSLYYKKITLSSFNFLKVCHFFFFKKMFFKKWNFLDDKSMYFGQESPLFFIYNGIPKSIGGWIVFFYLGLAILLCFWKLKLTKINRAKIYMLLLFLVPLVVYSYSTHKEARFELILLF